MVICLSDQPFDDDLTLGSTLSCWFAFRISTFCSFSMQKYVAFQSHIKQWWFASRINHLMKLCLSDQPFIETFNFKRWQICNDVFNDVLISSNDVYCACMQLLNIWDVLYLYIHHTSSVTETNFGLHNADFYKMIH